MKRRRHAFKPGLPPGTLPPEIESGKAPLVVEVVDYRHDGLTRSKVDAVPETIADVPPKTVRWLRLSGVPDRAALSVLGSQLGIHPLVLEDIASTRQRIKTENYDGYTFTVLRMLHHPPEENGAGDVQLVDTEFDLVLTDRVLVTVDEGDHPGLFAPILERLDNPGSLLRRGTVDMLYYAIFDLVVDQFFPLISSFEDRIEHLEGSIAQGPGPDQIEAIHHLRSDIRQMRSTMWAMRDVTANIERSGVFGMTDQTGFYFRDIHDHVIHILDSVSDLRESAGSLRELHVSGMSNRMNEIMKVLTIISTVFIPITFIAGIYGMNFLNMPELAYRWAYPAVVGLMLGIAALMVYFFKRRKWF